MENLEVQVLEELYNETSAPPSLDTASEVEGAMGDLAGDVVEPYSLTGGRQITVSSRFSLNLL